MPKLYGSLLLNSGSDERLLITRESVKLTPHEESTFWNIFDSSGGTNKRTKNAFYEAEETASDKHVSSSVPVAIAAIFTVVLIYVLSVLRHPQSRHPSPQH
jgi:hypothetical protein